MQEEKERKGEGKEREMEEEKEEERVRERGREEGDQTEGGGRGKRRMLVYNPDFHFFSQLVMYLIQVKRNHDVSCH